MDLCHPKEALKLLKEGNARFTSGAAISGKITATMRKALVKEGQAPHTAIIGRADSRAPLETVFDAMPGDIFVLRNAGNTCTHAEGSMVGSLEFCLGALQHQDGAWCWGTLPAEPSRERPQRTCKPRAATSLRLKYWRLFLGET